MLFINIWDSLTAPCLVYNTDMYTVCGRCGQYGRCMFIQATSQLRVTRSSRHTVNSSPVNSSQTRLITQSTRHNRAHNWYWWLPVPVCMPSGDIQKQCSTRTTYYRYLCYFNVYCRLQITATYLHFYEKHGQLVTTPRNTTVNSSHDFTA